MARKILEGSIAMARTAALCRPNVIAAYPITPSTHIPEELSKKLANYEFVPVEAEFSAISGLIGASCAGARTFTATSSQGLLLMHEALHNAAGMRLPIVMAVANRSVSAPLNIWCDWQDSLSQRDTGWMQLFCKNNQEAVDTLVQSFKIAETASVPVMVCVEGFYLTHLIAPVDIPSQEQVDAFLPAFRPKHALDVSKPEAFGTYAMPNTYYEIRKDHAQLMAASLPVVEKTAQEFEKAFGRKQFALMEDYSSSVKGAKTVIVSMAALSESIELVVDSMRAKKESVGLLRLKCFRPFPSKQLASALSGAERIIVFEKDLSLGLEGILATELKAALQEAGVKVPVVGIICGLGGKDVKTSELEAAYSKFKDAKAPSSQWL